MEDFKGKKILFIGPKFHGYQSLIKKELEKMGAVVDFYPERSYSFVFTFYNNFLKNSLDGFQQRHYRSILHTIGKINYDYLFVIRGFKMPVFFLEQFKRLNPSSRAIMYQWDSQNTNPFIHLKENFDVVKTFDFKDSDDFNISYLPLFYTEDVENLMGVKVKPVYDFFFMGFFFEERYEAVLKFRKFCEDNGYTLKSFLYMPVRTRVKYFFQGRKFDHDVVSYKHMERKEYLAILTKSKIMVDVSNPRQTGLAMRVIEALASGIKVATNNKNFRSDPSLRGSNAIDFFDLDKIAFSESFLTAQISNTSVLVLPVREWLQKIFFENET